MAVNSVQGIIAVCLQPETRFLSCIRNLPKHPVDKGVGQILFRMHRDSFASHRPLHRFAWLFLRDYDSSRGYRSAGRCRIGAGISDRFRTGNSRRVCLQLPGFLELFIQLPNECFQTLVGEQGDTLPIILDGPLQISLQLKPGSFQLKFSR